MSDEFNPITKWRCTRCLKWVKEPIGKICQECKDGTTKTKTRKV